MVVVLHITIYINCNKQKKIVNKNCQLREKKKKTEKEKNVTFTLDKSKL